MVFSSYHIKSRLGKSFDINGKLIDRSIYPQVLSKRMLKVFFSPSTGLIGLILFYMDAVINRRDVERGRGRDRGRERRRLSTDSDSLSPKSCNLMRIAAEFGSINQCRCFTIQCLYPSISFRVSLLKIGKRIPPGKIIIFLSI